MALYQAKNPETVDALKTKDGYAVINASGTVGIIPAAEFEAKYVPLPQQG